MMQTAINFIHRNLWRFEKDRHSYPRLQDRFALFIYLWKQTWWWPEYWPLAFFYDEETNTETRGWAFSLRVIPLLWFRLQYRFPCWDRLAIETSLRLSLFPGFPKHGEYMKATYTKVWAATNLLTYRSWQEAARHHGN